MWRCRAYRLGVEDDELDDADCSRRRRRRSGGCAVPGRRALPELLGITGIVRGHRLEALASLLAAQHVFAGLSWPDAKRVAAEVAWEFILQNRTVDDAAAAVMNRAIRARTGFYGGDWCDGQAVARAFSRAAGVLVPLDG